MSIHLQLKRIIERRETLTRGEAAALFAAVLRGEAGELEFAGVLAALAMRGETAAEVAGFVDTMRAAGTAVPLTDTERSQLVDTCGTGADSSGTFNISTAAALVAAAAGAFVAKHGNRAVTSLCGSADVLEALGVPVGLTPEQGADAIREQHFAFLHAPSLHPAMKVVMPVRRALGIRTIFHLVGPLSNPAGARAQVMGVYAPRFVALAAEAMALLGTRHAFVVHGDTGSEEGGLDELSISGSSQVAEVRDGVVTLSTITPEQFELDRAPIESLRGGGAATNAAILRAIFAGESGPRRDVVLLNAAAVLVTAELAPDLSAGITLARRTIDRGAVTELLANLARTS